MSAAAVRGVLKPLNRISQTTKELIREIKKHNRPRVIVQIRPSRSSVNILNFEIKNVGNTSARDIICRFSPDVRYQKTELFLSQLPVFNDLKLLAPKEELVFLFANAIDYLNDPANPTDIEATISYKDSDGGTYEDQITIKVNQLEKIVIVKEKGFDDMIGVLRRIERDLEKIEYLLRQMRS